MRFGRLTMSAVTAATALVAVAGVNTPAHAAQCSDSGDAGNKRALNTGYSGQWVVKQSDRKENFSGSARNITFSSGKSSTVTNTVAGYAKASAEAGLAWGKLQGEVGGSLEKVGTETAYKAFSETIRLKSGHVYVYARGARKHTMSVTFQVCQYQHPAGYIWHTYDTSKATGWKKADTWIACDKNMPAGSFSQKVKQVGC